jgi:hypothetical protein
MKRLIITAAFAFSFLISCAGVSMKTPEGFALFDKEKNYKAVSADGIYLTGRIVKDKGSDRNSDLSTWESEVSRSLLSKGYTSVSKISMTGSAGDARYSEYEVIFNGESYAYAVFLSRNGNSLFIVESGGRKDRFSARRNDIVEAMKTAYIR